MALIHLRKTILFLALLLIGNLFSLPLQSRPALSHATFKALEKIDRYREKQQRQKEIKALLDLSQKVENKAYDLAIVEQYLAFAYIEQGDYALSQKYADKALKSNLMPKEGEQSLRYLLGQLALQNYYYQQSIRLFKQYLDKANKPNSEINYLIAFGYYHLSQWEQAEKQLNKAIAMQRRVPEDWYKLLINIYLEEKNYFAAEQALQSLIAATPAQAIWWKLLTQLYLIQDKYEKALASLSLAYQKKHLDNHDIQQLMQLYNYNIIPEKAARLLQSAIQSKQLAGNYSNFKLLFQLWSVAKEKNKAIEALNKALENNPNGYDYLLLGQTFMQIEDWSNASLALQEVTRFELADDKQKHQLEYWLARLHEQTKSSLD